MHIGMKFGENRQSLSSIEP